MAGIPWSNKQLKILKELWPKVPEVVSKNELSNIIGKSIPAINCKASSLQLEKKYNDRINHELLKEIESRFEITECN